MAEGAHHSGAWRGNRRQGQGEMAYGTADRFVGEWQDNRRLRGCLTYANGDEYDGEFVWVYEISGSVPASHLGGWDKAEGWRQGDVFFPAGGATINGVSKAYAMTGWRIGYIACTNNSIVGSMKKIQSHATSGPCSISQEAAIAALNTKIKDILPMRDAYKKRHDNVLSALNAIDGIECISTDGSFYLFPNCT